MGLFSRKKKDKVAEDINMITPTVIFDDEAAFTVGDYLSPDPVTDNRTDEPDTVDNHPSLDGYFSPFDSVILHQISITIYEDSMPFVEHDERVGQVYSLVRQGLTGSLKDLSETYTVDIIPVNRNYIAHEHKINLWLLSYLLDIRASELHMHGSNSFDYIVYLKEEVDISISSKGYSLIVKPFVYAEDEEEVDDDGYSTISTKVDDNF